MAKTIEADWLMKYFGGMDNDEYLPVEYVLEIIKHAPEAREKSERTHDVIEAMERYARAEELIPIEWIKTLKRLIS